MLILPEHLANQVRAHAVETYPHECCGALLGRDTAQGREVQEVLPLVNRRDDSPRNRFSITPEDYRVAETAARERGSELIGWYHSHPDHPPLPSEYDREHAWPWFSYVILSVVDRDPREMAAWRLSEDRIRFEPESIQTRQDSATARSSTTTA